MNLHFQKVLPTVAVGLLVLFSTCKRDGSVYYVFPYTNTSPKLPEITSEGKNTYGCKVNGEVWVTNDYWADYGIDGSLIVQGKKGNWKETVSFKIYNFLSKGNPCKLTFKGPTEGSGGYSQSPKGWWIDTTHIGYLTLNRFDTINYIISGTFYFDAYNAQDNSVVHITEGRFDIKYH